MMKNSVVVRCRDSPLRVQRCAREEIDREDEVGEVESLGCRLYYLVVSKWQW